jgi:prepilin-type N-terminal cleavage/methylation domain-containing protein
MRIECRTVGQLDRRTDKRSTGAQADCPGVCRSEGFTLIELMVALTISGIVVLVAARMFGAVGDAGRDLRDARATLDRDMNARRLLAASFLSLEIGQTVGSAFEGHPDRMTFSTWQLVPGGWLEPRRASLAAAGGRLMLSLSSSPITLADSVMELRLDYLLEPGLDATWVREWISPVSAPVAVRMRIRRGRGDRA